jgi:hypothetical protein
MSVRLGSPAVDSHCYRIKDTPFVLIDCVARPTNNRLSALFCLKPIYNPSPGLSFALSPYSLCADIIVRQLFFEVTKVKGLHDINPVGNGKLCRLGTAAVTLRAAYG